MTSTLPLNETKDIAFSAAMRFSTATPSDMLVAWRMGMSAAAWSIVTPGERPARVILLGLAGLAVGAAQLGGDALAAAALDLGYPLALAALAVLEARGLIPQLPVPALFLGAFGPMVAADAHTPLERVRRKLAGALAAPIAMFIPAATIWLVVPFAPRSVVADLNVDVQIVGVPIPNRRLPVTKRSR